MPPNIHLTSALFIATLVTKLVCKTVCQKKQIPKERGTLPFPSFPFPFSKILWVFALNCT